MNVRENLMLNIYINKLPNVHVDVSVKMKVSWLTYYGREGVCFLIPESFICGLSLFIGESVRSPELLASWVR